nr:hypothetical protein [Tanacetum cinerariifolium]
MNEMIDYVLEKYGNKWLVDDAISNGILNSLLRIEFSKQQHEKTTFVDDKGKTVLKDDKGNGTLKETSSDDTPPSTHPFQTSSDDTLKSSFEDTCSFDET